VAIALFPVCLLLHELDHLLVLRLLGGHGELIVRPWRAQFLPLTLPSVHVTGAGELALPARLAFDFGGPGLVALALTVAGVRLRSRLLAAALIANAAILLFYALIEAGDVVLDLAGAEAGLLGWEEFNYGVPLLVVLIAAAAAARLPSPDNSKRGQAPSSKTPPTSTAAAAGR
jgi:hypothetical protein